MLFYHHHISSMRGSLTDLPRAVGSLGYTLPPYLWVQPSLGSSYGLDVIEGLPFVLERPTRTSRSSEIFVPLDLRRKY